MKAKAVLKNLNKVSPVILLAATYALPLTLTVLQDAGGIDGKSSVFFGYPMGIVIWLLLLLAVGLSCWHLFQRRRIAESMLTLLFALPMMFLCVGAIHHDTTDQQAQLNIQFDAPVADRSMG
ncbi:MAG: hypothetical protein V4607_01585 [Pseudomonadota bacterium]